jgi:hypothetical protein
MTTSETKEQKLTSKLSSTVQEKLNRFDRGEFSSVYLNNIYSSHERGLVHEWARNHDYASKSYHVVSSDVELPCTKCGTDSLTKDGKPTKCVVKISPLIDDWCLARISDDGGYECLVACCNTCHVKFYVGDMNGKIPRKWVATDVMLVMKTSESHKQYPPPSSYLNTELSCFGDAPGNWKSRDNNLGRVRKHHLSDVVEEEKKKQLVSYDHVEHDNAKSTKELEKKIDEMEKELRNLKLLLTANF